MTFTYDTSLLASPENEKYDLTRARLILGDTDAKEQLLQDEEIETLLDAAASFQEGVARAGEAILARYTHEASFSVGNWRVELEKRIDHMRDLVKTVREQRTLYATPSGPMASSPPKKGARIFRTNMMRGGSTDPFVMGLDQ